MNFELKPGEESFTVVDGPDAGKTYEKGTVYDQVPTGYEGRFKKIKPAPVKKQTKDTSGGKS